MARGQCRVSFGVALFFFFVIGVKTVGVAGFVNLDCFWAFVVRRFTRWENRFNLFIGTVLIDIFDMKSVPFDTPIRNHLFVVEVNPIGDWER